MEEPRKLDILYVGTLPPHQGGSAVTCALLLGDIARRGHTIRALAPITAETQRLEDPFAVSHPEISVTRFLIPYFHVSPDIPASEEFRETKRRQILRILPELIAQRRPDILFIGRESFACYTVPLAEQLGLPCLLRLSGLLTDAVLRGTYPSGFTVDFLRQMKKADVVIAQAEHMAASLREAGYANIRTIPNPVDLEQFSPRARDGRLLNELGIPGDDIVLMHISNMKACKRLMDIVCSAEMALRHRPDLFYLIVGDGPLRQEMQKACKQRRVAHRFHFTGWVDYSRIPDYFSAADVVVMPSEFEQQARVYLETQASSRVLLASDITSARELVEHNETGLLFRMGDCEDLAAKTILAAGDPVLRARIGRQARERVKAHDLNIVVSAFLSTMKQAIGGHSKN